MLQQQTTQHPSAHEAYIRHGWSLVAIPHGTKGPRTQGWNLRENAMTDLPAGHGIGLAHAYSGTMALDIDDWIGCQSALDGIVNLSDLYGAPDAVVIDSGRPGRGKLLYAMPAGMTLPTKKVTRNGKTVYELRCATSGGLTVQDVLPPTIHPETGQPYRWAGNGHWTRLPQIPAPLLEHWQGMSAQDAASNMVVDNLSTGVSLHVSWSDIKTALEVIPADCPRDEWIQVGMALHYAGDITDSNDSAYMLWRDWSMTSAEKYPGDVNLSIQWKSFSAKKATAVKLGTLFRLAGNYGYVRQIDASSLFAPTTASPDLTSSVLAEAKPSPPDIDLSLFPPVLAQRAKEVSESVGCDPLVPLWAGLSAVTAVIDSRSRLEITHGFRVPPVLWLMTIGDPADKKSPGSRPMLTLLRQLEAEAQPAYKKDLLDWQGKEAAYSAAKKAYLDWCASPDALLGGDAPAVPDLPAAPAAPKITVSDITSQKLVRNCADRPQGLLCYLDEMNGWVKKLTDKNSGEDRSAWVVAYEAEAYEMDRVGAGTIRADNMSVAIYGNIQPQVYRDNLKSLSADGLLQRFIPAILRHDKTRMGQPIPDMLTSQPAWENALRVIHALPPTTYRLDATAYARYREFQAWYESTKADERLLSASNAYMTAFGKLEGLVGRLALVCHALDNPFSVTVSESTLMRVIELVKTYIIPAYKYSLDVITEQSNFDLWLHDYILQHSDLQQFNLIELKRTARRHLDGMSPWQQDNVVMCAMMILEQANWVARLDDGLNENRGHAIWAVNPDLHIQYAKQRRAIIDAKQRRVDSLYRNSSKGRVIKTHGFNE